MLEDVGFVFKRKRDGRGRFACHTFGGVDPSGRLGKFDVAKDGVFPEVVGDGSHRSRGAI